MDIEQRLETLEARLAALEEAHEIDERGPPLERIIAWVEAMRSGLQKPAVPLAE